jgi:outer membrane biosynthesis protein TonB
MQRPLLLIAIIGIVIILAVTVAGYYLGKVAENRQTEPSPTAEPSATPSPSPSPSTPPSPSPSPSPSLLPTAPPVSAKPSPRAVVRGAATVAPTVAPTPAPVKTVPVRISFVDLPASVPSGESFTIQWRVEGPEGLGGENTTLLATLEHAEEHDGSNSSSSSTTENSFGPFQIPRTFSTNLALGGDGGEIHLTATAEVGGKAVTTEASVRLTH